MAAVRFNVPEAIKRDFQETFAGENRSAIVADLMRRAVAERRRQQRRSQAIDLLLELRRELPPASTEQVRRARRAGPG